MPSTASARQQVQLQAVNQASFGIKPIVPGSGAGPPALPAGTGAYAAVGFTYGGSGSGGVAAGALGRGIAGRAARPCACVTSPCGRAANPCTPLLTIPLAPRRAGPGGAAGGGSSSSEDEGSDGDEEEPTTAAQAAQEEEDDRVDEIADVYGLSDFRRACGRARLGAGAGPRRPPVGPARARVVCARPPTRAARRALPRSYKLHKALEREGDEEARMRPRPRCVRGNPPRPRRVRPGNAAAGGLLQTAQQASSSPGRGTHARRCRAPPA